MLGAALALATAAATSAAVMVEPASNVAMHPFCAPAVRSSRVRRRVSMPAMATAPSRCRYSPSVCAARKLDMRGGTSLTMSPAAWIRVASTSSTFTP